MEVNNKLKIKKNGIIIGIALLSLCLLFAIGKITYVQSHKSEATKFITEKYGIEERNITLLSYKPSRFRIQEGDVIPFDWYRSNESWNLKYNGKTFSVVRNSGRNNELGDNYQLEDLFEWSVRYLRENVNENIVGIRIEAETYNNIFTEEAIKSYLDSTDDLTIYYSVESINEYYDVDRESLNSNFYDLKTEISNSCKSIIGNKNITLYLLDEELLFERRQVVTNESSFLYCYDIKGGSTKLKGELKLVGE